MGGEVVEADRAHHIKFIFVCGRGGGGIFWESLLMLMGVVGFILEF